ncbi:MAG: IgGFc-binding protein [Myxococcales bacterium]|nr:IgGFc-binding protein [Myxococcales bacterium]
MATPEKNLALLPIVGIGCLLALGCAELEKAPAGSDGGPAIDTCIEDCDDDGGGDACIPFTIMCQGTRAISCDAEGRESVTECAGMDQVCSSGIGCTECRASAGRCMGNASQRCLPDGSGWGELQACETDAGFNCDARNGLCENLCQAAADDRSYLGCEYWPTVTSTAVAPDFPFAVVISNPQVIAAKVTISRAGAEFMTLEVQPGQVQPVELPWIEELRLRVPVGVVSAGAYQLQSSVPVAVYQFSPLSYRIDRDCENPEDDDEPGDDECFSYSNDASLLLPTHILDRDYMVVARPSNQTLTRFRRTEDDQYLIDNDGNIIRRWAAGPGFVTIVGVEDEPVEVQVDLKAHTMGSPAGFTSPSAEAVSAYAAGDTASVTLGKGDVLQILSAIPRSVGECNGSPTLETNLSCGPPGSEFACIMEETFCELGPDYDLTGSRVRASGKVFVISGHHCTFVPKEKSACDHLEESAFPLLSWDKQYVVAHSQPVDGEPNLVRIISGAEGNVLSFEPAVWPETTLNSGEMLEFYADRDFVVSGTEALAVTQFMVGQNFSRQPDPNALMDQRVGDPSMTFVPPLGQFRLDYDFLTPASYEQSWVTVVAGDDSVTLDDQPLTGLTPIGDSGWSAVRVELEPGAHRMRGDSPFGITVYGFGSYTSYMYPGGLNFVPLNDVL